MPRSSAHIHARHPPLIKPAMATRKQASRIKGTTRSSGSPSGSSPGSSGPGGMGDGDGAGSGDRSPRPLAASMPHSRRRWRLRGAGLGGRVEAQLVGRALQQAAAVSGGRQERGRPARAACRAPQQLQHRRLIAGQRQWDGQLYAVDAGTLPATYRSSSEACRPPNRTRCVSDTIDLQATRASWLGGPHWENRALQPAIARKSDKKARSELPHPTTLARGEPRRQMHGEELLRRRVGEVATACAGSRCASPCQADAVPWSNMQLVSVAHAQIFPLALAAKHLGSRARARQPPRTLTRPAFGACTPVGAWGPRMGRRQEKAVIKCGYMACGWESANSVEHASRRSCAIARLSSHS